MNTGGKTSFKGSLEAVYQPAQGFPAPLRWRLRNGLRKSFLQGLAVSALVRGVSRATGVITLTSELMGSLFFIRDEDRVLYERLREYARHDPDPSLGEMIRQILDRRVRINYGTLAYRVITDNGVAFLVDDWDADTTDITTMNFHACGTGAVAENQTDSALGAEATTITDRVAGTKSQPAANQLRSVGTQSFTGSGAITEHGLFSVITESAGVLWDRSVFAAINVVNGDSIQWTYTCTVAANG